VLPENVRNTELTLEDISVGRPDDIHWLFPQNS